MFVLSQSRAHKKNCDLRVEWNRINRAGKRENQLQLLANKILHKLRYSNYLLVVTMHTS
jgi:hypothetical protein